jgi:16S rRNA (adenine1518-N6/adenine1519-N6)-dimethyltransferase
VISQVSKSRSTTPRNQNPFVGTPDLGHPNRVGERTKPIGPGVLVSESVPAKPRLGQNFLRDAQAIERIARALGDLGNETVVEIGPGRGAITRALAGTAGQVVAIELDRELAEHLRSEFASERVTVVQADVLGFDFEAAAAHAGKPLVVTGNLPYYITSPILSKLAKNHRSIDRAVLMVQREVADRIVAVPGSRDFGVLSVTVQIYGPVEALFTLPPGAFWPPPDVHSTVFRWQFAPRFAELGVDEDAFPAFVRRAFAQKRKTLANNLRAAGFAPETIGGALSRASIESRARAEALSVKELAAVWIELGGARDPHP